MKMTSTCIFCKRRLIEHSPKEALSCFENIIRGENIECALKLCNGIEVADITCGADEQLIQKPTRSFRRSVSS